MNCARVIIGRGYASLTVCRLEPAFNVRKTILKQNTASVPSSLLLNQRNYNALCIGRNIIQPASQVANQMQLTSNVIDTPSRHAHKTAVQKVNAAVNIFKKRPLRKRPRLDELSAQGFFNVSAFATAEEYDLDTLLVALKAQNLYATKQYFSTEELGAQQNVLYVTAKYQVGSEMRDIFFFRDGAVVLWNFDEIETNNVLSFLRPFEKDSYSRTLVRGESEVMPYTYIPQSAVDVEGDLVSEADIEPMQTAFFHHGKFFLTADENNFLQKYTFSNAMASSIKLGIWEATLEGYIDSLELLTEDLKKGRRIRNSRGDLLRKTGELFALRHVVNLSSDLLDTPDFYWDREELENLYLQVCSYFSITRRTKVVNEKITHCIELAELVSHNLNDAHHIRLEWMIIILIMVEVGFEIVHYTDRYYNKNEEEFAIGSLNLTA